MARDRGCPPGSVCPKCGRDLQCATINVADWCAPTPVEWSVPDGTIAMQAHVVCPACRIIHAAVASCSGYEARTWFSWRSLLRCKEDQAVASLLAYLEPKEGSDGTDGGVESGGVS